MNLVINFIGFQIGWFACVIGAAQSLPFFSILCALVIVAFHLYRNNSSAELYIIITAIVIGFIWETLLLSTGWLSYSLTSDSLVFAPIWLVAMWALFASTVNHSMAWLKGRWLLASLLGAIFGPLAFIAGETFGAVVFLDRFFALLSLVLGWAVLMPLLLWLADKFQNRFENMEN